MQAVILAAGEGKRMRPLTEHMPKPLIEIAGKPIIEHIIDALPPEIDEVVIVVGYKADMIIKRLGNSYGGRAIRYVHQWMPAGTAHALSIARPFLSGTFLFMNADDIHGKEALAQALAHPLAILVSPHETPQKFGVIELGKDGTLTAIAEKPEEPKSNLVNTGAMVLDERIFTYPSERHDNGEYYITDPFSSMAKDHAVKVIEQELWIPVGCPEDIPLAEEILKNRKS